MAKSEKFMLWVEWMQKNRPIQPMTNTQARFADKVLNDIELEQMLSNPGDIETILKSIQFFLKNEKN
jgi:hypothetical protein